MKHLISILLSALLVLTSAVSPQSAAGEAAAPPAIPDDPDSMFETGAGDTTQNAPSPPPAPGTAASVPLFQARAVEVGGALYSDYTGFLTWNDSYPDTANLSAGVSSRFVPNLEADLYFDARPFETVRVFTRFKAAYPFSSPVSGPGTPAVPSFSVFEVYADINWNDRLYFRAGQQVVNWGVGYFFSPADIISLTPIDPLRPDLERPGPLALKINAPFADVDNLYLYVVANQEFARDGTFRLDDFAVAPRIEVLLGGWEIGLGAYYQNSQRPKAMMTATGSLFAQLGLFAEGVLSRGMDRILAQEIAGAPGAFQTSSDTTTPTFSGTIGVRYLQTDWHLSITAQYYYNGQGYADHAKERAAFSAYALQLRGMPPLGPALSQADVFQPGRNYLAARASWTDILNSRVDLALFYEGNLSDGSGVTSPSISFTPFRYFTLTFAPYISYGGDNTEFVSLFGRFSLSMKLTIGAVSF